MTREEKIALFTRWIEALRSGQYEQGQNYLRVGSRYCCLGVLCEIAGVEAERALTTDHYLFGECRDDRLLPNELAGTGLGLYGRLTTPVAIDGGVLSCLTQFNDLGYSFAEIADVIEAQYLRPLLEEAAP
jgi:hypothetical protein